MTITSKYAPRLSTPPTLVEMVGKFRLGIREVRAYFDFIEHINNDMFNNIIKISRLLDK